MSCGLSNTATLPFSVSCSLHLSLDDRCTVRPFFTKCAVNFEFSITQIPGHPVPTERNTLRRQITKIYLCCLDFYDPIWKLVWSWYECLSMVKEVAMLALSNHHKLNVCFFFTPRKQQFHLIKCYTNTNKVTHSSSSSVAKRLTLKPLSAFPPGFWTSSPPINLANRFSSSLARGLGAALTCWHKMAH